jgi:hypothetical protein
MQCCSNPKEKKRDRRNWRIKSMCLIKTYFIFDLKYVFINKNGEKIM